MKEFDKHYRFYYDYDNYFNQEKDDVDYRQQVYEQLKKHLHQQTIINTSKPKPKKVSSSSTVSQELATRLNAI